jgi:hypothetical protein
LLTLPASSDHIGPGGLRDTRVGSRPLPAPPPQSVPAQPSEPRSLAKAMHTLSFGVFSYVVALVSLFAIFAIGVTWRIRRNSAANARRARKQPVAIVS